MIENCHSFGNSPSMNVLVTGLTSAKSLRATAPNSARIVPVLRLRHPETVPEMWIDSIDDTERVLRVIIQVPSSSFLSSRL